MRTFEVSASIRDGARGWTAPEFEALFLENRHFVFRYVTSRVGHHQADDLTAQVFAEAWRERISYDHARGTPRSWLFGIARNVSRGFHRREGVRSQPYGRVTTSVDYLDEDAVVARVDAQAATRDLLAALDPIDQEIVMLLGYGRLTFEEIGSVLDMPVGTVKSRVSRARARLDHLRGPRSGGVVR